MHSLLVETHLLDPASSASPALHPKQLSSVVPKQVEHFVEHSSQVFVTIQDWTHSSSPSFLWYPSGQLVTHFCVTGSRYEPVAHLSQPFSVQVRQPESHFVHLLAVMFLISTYSLEAQVLLQVPPSYSKYPTSQTSHAVYEVQLLQFTGHFKQVFYAL